MTARSEPEPAVAPTESHPALRPEDYIEVGGVRYKAQAACWEPLWDAQGRKEEPCLSTAAPAH